MAITETNDERPKRGRGRPKGSKDKSNRVFKKIKPHKARLTVPKNPLIYKARRLSWLIQAIEQRMEDDPLYIDSKKYIELLEKQEAVQDQLIKEGLHTSEGRKAHYAGIQSGSLAENGESGSAPSVGEGKSAGVGDGVSAPNPFRR